MDEIKTGSGLPEGVTEETTIEEAFGMLREILSGMQDPKVTLEESFALYENGMKLVRFCDSRIDRVEKQIEQLNADGSVERFELS